MNRVVLGLGVVGLMAFGACGDDGGDGGGGGNAIGQGASRSGPEALGGFTWGTQQSVNGIDFDFAFEFGTATVVATNTCSQGGQVLTAEVEAPVEYRYRATVTQAGQAGDEACHVAVAQGTLDFTIAGNTLTAVSEGETLTFTSTGTRSGVFGDWSAEMDGFTLTWSMVGGKINASAACPGGGSAKVSVPATFTNFVEIKEAKEQTVGDESFDCSVAVTAGTGEYTFEGKTLVLNFGGQELRFTPE